MVEIGDHGLDTFPKILRYNAEKWGDQVSLRKKDFGIWHEYTWQDAYREACHFALGLLSLGFGRGEHLSIIGENAPQWFCGQWGTQMMRGIVTGIYSDATPEEVKYIVGHSDSKVVLAHDQEQVDKLLQIKGDLPLLSRIIYWDKKGLRNYDDPLLLYYGEVLKIGQEWEINNPKLIEELVDKGTGEDICLLLYTSGTTGVQKGVMITHKSLIASTKFYQQIFDLNRGDHVMSMFPAAWYGEQAFVLGLSFVAAATIHYPEKPETVQADLREISPAYIAFGPRQWEGLCSTVQVKMKSADILKRSIFNLFMPVAKKKASCCIQKRRVPFYIKLADFVGQKIVFDPLRDKLGLAKARIFVNGGSAVSSDSVVYLHSLGIPIRVAYATTECGFVCGHYANDIQPDTMGCAPPGVKFKISDTQELLVSGDSLFKGYYKDPKATEEVMKDGWFYTGDAVILRDNGHLVYIDRVSEMGQLSSGAIYSPQYIEGHLRFCPYIKDAIIIGGKERPYLSAIINIDFESVAKWAEDNNIGFTTFVDLSQKSATEKLVLPDIQRVNKVLPQETRIKKFVLLHKEFDADEGELTRTRKLKRGVMQKTYENLIEAIYEEKDSVTINAPVKYRDGRTGIIKTELKIRTAPIT